MGCDGVLAVQPSGVGFSSARVNLRLLTLDGSGFGSMYRIPPPASVDKIKLSMSVSSHFHRNDVTDINAGEVLFGHVAQSLLNLSFCFCFQWIKLSLKPYTKCLENNNKRQPLHSNTPGGRFALREGALCTIPKQRHTTNTCKRAIIGVRLAVMWWYPGTQVRLWHHKRTTTNHNDYYHFGW